MKLLKAQLVVAIVSCIPLCSAYPKLIVAGGTNVADKAYDGLFRGWSGYVQPLLNVSVTNRATALSSVRSTYNTPAWERTLALVQKKDFVVLEFGLDDEGDPQYKPKNGTYNLKPSLPGTGDETVTLKYEVVDTVRYPNGTEKPVKGSAKNVTEVVHTFGWYLKNMIIDVRENEAHVIISSRIPKNWSTTGNKTTDMLPTDYVFRDHARKVAEEMKADFVDHTYYTLRYLKELGPVDSKKLYGLGAGKPGPKVPADLYTSKEGGKGMADFSILTNFALLHDLHSPTTTTNPVLPPNLSIWKPPLLPLITFTYH